MTRRQRTCAKVVRGLGSHMQRLCLRAQLHPATALDPPPPPPPPPPLPPETQRQLCRQIRLAPAHMDIAVTVVRRMCSVDRYMCHQQCCGAVVR